jgi:hypothetical protein
VMCFAVAVIRVLFSGEPLKHKASASEETGRENEQCGDGDLGGAHASDKYGR